MMRSVGFEIELVDLRVQAVVVGAERSQHAPNDGETGVVVQRRGGIHALRDGDRQHDVAVLLAFGLAHGAAHRLHDVHLGAARRHEQHGVQRRHVDALGKAAGVGKDAAGVGVFALQPLDAGLAVQRVVLAVHVLGLGSQRLPLLRFGQLLDGAVHDVAPVFHQTFRGTDGVGEGNRPLEGPSSRRRAPLRILQRCPAANDLRGIGDVELAGAGGQVRLHGGVDVPFRECEHQHLVVRKQPLLHRSRERQAV